MIRKLTRALPLVAIVALLPSFAPGVAASSAPRPAAAHAHHAGDLDGDGKSDLVISDFDRVRITYTHAKPSGSHVQEVLSPGGIVSSVAVGDFNNDGYSDLAIGDDSAHPDSEDGAYDGAVYVFPGSASGVASASYKEFAGPTNSTHAFGYQLATGDVDGDHRADLVVSDENSPTYTLLFGGSGGLTAGGAQHKSFAGAAAFALGDVNHDGRADLVVGLSGAGKTHPIEGGDAYITEGEIKVVYGTAKGLASKKHTYHGRAAGVGYGGLGNSVAIGKVNGDKYGDVVVGAETASLTHKSEVGKVVVFYGNKKGISTKHRTVIDADTKAVPGKTHEGDGFGHVVSIGDVNGDGRGDLVITQLGSTSLNPGHLFVVRGTKSGVTGKHSQRFSESSAGLPKSSSDSSDDEFGFSVVTFHPLTGKYASVAVSAPYWIKNDGDYGAGFVDILKGSHAGLTTKGSKRISAPTEKRFLGEELAP